MVSIASLCAVESGRIDDLVNAYTGLSVNDVSTAGPRTTPPWSNAPATNSTGTLHPTYRCW